MIAFLHCTTFRVATAAMLEALVAFVSTLSPVAISSSTVVVLIVACLTFGSHRVLRWPLLVWAIIHVAFDMSIVALTVAALGLWDTAVRCFHVRCLGKVRKLQRQRLEAACSWAAYRAAGIALDSESEATMKWQAESEHPAYNAALVRQTLDRLRAARAANDVASLIDVLGTCVRKSFCGIDAEALYSHCHCGTKRLISLYVDEVVAALGDVQVQVGKGDEAYDERVRSLLYRSQRIFGRTCLALSGGGGLANFSWGVARALYDQKLLPSLICGSSAGAVVGAALCTRTDEELDGLLQAQALADLLTSFDEPRMTVLRRFLRTGCLYDPGHWLPRIQAVCNQAAHPDLTFAEAFALSGREFCVTVTARRRHEPPLVLSRLSAPDVTVASAILATVAMPFLIPAQRLMCKGADGELRPWAAAAPTPPGVRPGMRPAAGASVSFFEEDTEDIEDAAGGEWRDGSIVHDTPREQLAQHFGASFTVTSQCNPHVVPLAIALKPGAGQPAVSRLQRGRSEWRGGFAVSALLVWLLADAKKWLTLMRELEILPLLLGTDWSSVFLQEFTGDITIMPPLGLRDYLRVLSDPTPQTGARYLRIGARETFRKLPMLMTRLRIAHALRDLKAALAQSDAAHQAARDARDARKGESTWAWRSASSLLQGDDAEGAPIKRNDSMLCF